MRYLESGVMKGVVLKYDSRNIGCDILDSRDNGGISGFEK